MRITFEEASRVLAYNSETGELRWLVGGSGKRAGDIAGTPHNKGYWAIEVAGFGYLAHRLAWLLVHGVWPAGQIDHINGDRRDNRLANLREVTNAQNAQNKRKARSDNVSGLMGVRRMGGKWQARIMTNGKSTCIGVFETAEAASLAYINTKRATHEMGTI